MTDRELTRQRIAAWREEFSLERECAPYRDMTPEVRARWLSSACRGAISILRSHGDPGAALAWQDPLSAESLRLWARLREERRLGRGA